MNFSVAVFAKANELEQRLVKKVGVSGVMNVLDGFAPTTLTDPMLPLKHSVSFSSPFR